MSGAWTVSQAPDLRIHTFTAPEEGWLVTSHIVELPRRLLVVDAQYTLAFAKEVARYAAALNKPIDRLYVTHYHPDHLMGAAAFDAPLLTLASVADKIGLAGDRVAREEHEKVGDDVPDHARMPDRRVDEGEEVIDGVRVVHMRLRQAETEDALVIALPGSGAIIVQDLVYDRSHLFLGERDFDGWRAALRAFRALPYVLVLPGHGFPGGPELYDRMLDYLDFAEDALKAAADRDDFKRRILDRFPDYGARKVLDHQLRFLFR
jgi:glyoxylase-like metal-dependent hydrolase (beta-lactamase superfamily II)